MHLKNLRVYESESEEYALNLFFVGNVNRITSETPMNLASSRSHAVFTMTFESSSTESPMVTTSKLHVVDLAGSERIFRNEDKDYREGQIKRTRQEGKCINLSLHYLEQTIMALQSSQKVKTGNSKEDRRKSKGGSEVHVPYRNSVLTQVLRDSLGGNCMTVFISTINPGKSVIHLTA